MNEKNIHSLAGSGSGDCSWRKWLKGWNQCSWEIFWVLDWLNLNSILSQYEVDIAKLKCGKIRIGINLIHTRLQACTNFVQPWSTMFEPCSTLINYVWTFQSLMNCAQPWLTVFEHCIKTLFTLLHSVPALLNITCVCSHKYIPTLCNIVQPSA